MKLKVAHSYSKLVRDYQKDGFYTGFFSVICLLALSDKFFGKDALLHFLEKFLWNINYSVWVVLMLLLLCNYMIRHLLAKAIKD